MNKEFKNIDEILGGIEDGVNEGQMGGVENWKEFGKEYRALQCKFNGDRSSPEYIREKEVLKRKYRILNRKGSRK